MSSTHFGFQTVDEKDKASRVRGVFDSVASKYDVMNDLMSGGLHRIWKAFTIGRAAIRPGMRVLDIAGGHRGKRVESGVECGDAVCDDRAAGGYVVVVPAGGGGEG